MKYLLIFEDGAIFKTNELYPSDLQSCEEGMLDIIRVNDSKQYDFHTNNWIDIQLVDRQWHTDEKPVKL